MKLKEKLAEEAIFDLHASAFDLSADILIKLERKAFILGFEMARELAALHFKNSWNNPKYMGYEFNAALDSISNDCLNLGEEELK